MRLESLVRAAVISLCMVGCLGVGGCRGGDSEEPGIDQPMPTQPPPALGTTTLKILLRDAVTDAAIPAGTLSLISDAGGILDTSSETFAFSGAAIELPLREDRLADSDQNDILDRPYTLRFSAKAEGFLPTVVEVPVNRAGINARDVVLVSVASPAPGVSAVQQNVDLATASAPIEVHADTPAGAVAVKISLPPGTEFRSASGALLDNSTLQVLIAGYDPGNPESLSLFPGGLNAIIENPGQIAAGDGEEVTSPEVRFISAGLATIELQDADGNVARHVLNGQAVSVRISVSPGVTNPDTGKLVTVGDDIPYWSLDNSSGTWRYEGQLKIRSDENGLYGEFETNHFSSYNLDWYERQFAQNCDSVNISVVDENGNIALAQGAKVLVTSNYFNGNTGQNIGAYYNVRYQGDGVLSFNSAPEEMVAIYVLPEADGTRNLEIARLVSGPERAEIGQVLNGVLHDIPLCYLSNATLTLKRGNLRPKFSAWSSSRTEGDSGSTPVAVTATLAGVLSTPVSVRYSLVSGSAIQGNDFIAAGSGEVTFAPGESRKQFTVAELLGDTVYEPEESFRIEFDSVDAHVLSRSIIQYIPNDDTPTLVLSADTVREGEGVTAGVTARFEEAISGWIRVYLTPSRDSSAIAGADYLSMPITDYGATWYGGSEQEQVVTEIKLLDDRDVEGDEEVVYDVHLEPDYYELPESLKKVRIRITDDGDAILSGVPDVRVEEEGQTLSYMEPAGDIALRVQLSHAYSKPVEVRIKAAGADSGGDTASEFADYEGVTSSTVTVLTFAPGEATKLLPIRIRDDLEYESPETFTLVGTINTTSGSNPVRENLLPQTVQIRDNDAPYAYVSGVLYEDDERGLSRYNSARLNVSWPAPYDISLAIDSGTALEGQLTGLPSNFTLPASSNFLSLDLSAIDDEDSETTRCFDLIASVVDGAASIGAPWSDTPTFGCILFMGSDPLPVVTLTAASTNIVDEGGILQFGLALDRASTRDLQVTLSKFPNDSRVQLPSVITIPAGSTFVNFAVPVADDRQYQGQTRVTIGVTSNGGWPNASFAYGTIRASDVTGGGN